MMWCPFYWGRCMCGVRNSGLYVPPKEIEIEHCTGEYRRCPRFRDVERHAAVGQVGSDFPVKEERKARKPPRE